MKKKKGNNVMKTILITGSGKRLGRNLAELFSKKGYKIIIHFHQSENGAKDLYKQITDNGGEAFMIKADLTNAKNIKKMFSDLKDKVGNIDILINNAAILPDKMALDSIDEIFWDSVMNINLRAAMLCSREFVKNAQEGARIINIASLGGQEVWDKRISYNVSKAGLLHLNKALARELAPKISVNSVSPGTVYMPEESSDDLILSADKIPMQRYGSAVDIFEAVYFFAECTRYITGQNLNVDGGYHL